MKNIISLLLSLLVLFGLASCHKKGEVVILYTNDIRSYVNNTIKNKDGSSSAGLSYDSVSKIKKDLQKEGKNVLLLDCGNHIQGTAYGAMDEGAHIISFMNEASYDAATFGNHEFDYGYNQFMKLIKKAKFPYLSCNFYKTDNNKLLFSPYKIFKCGSSRVGIIGISSPYIIKSSATSYFMNKQMNKFEVNFYGGKDGKELYEAVQRTIDKIRPKCDYVIGLGHLGSRTETSPYMSLDVIKNTHGLDAFIDGHSRQEIERKEVYDKEQYKVILSEAGAAFSCIGSMTLRPEGISTYLYRDYETRDETLKASIDSWITTVNTQLDEQIAVSEVDLCITDPLTGDRMVRRKETNLGDLIADSYYFYFNEIDKAGCDVGFNNGGGIRIDVPKGEISARTAKTVQPFGNIVCLVEMKGQTLLDMLEWGCRSVGAKDKSGKLLENGGFPQVAGLKMKIDSNMLSTVQGKATGIWQGKPTGLYKVQDIEIYNKETHSYEALDLNKTYKVGGINYLLINGGDGYAMLKDVNVITDYVSEDYLIQTIYLKTFDRNDNDGFPHISTATSPLSLYKGYEINYENPYGASRIIIK